MIYNFDGVSITTLGDPHLGRSFVNGVPLHRRGEREKMVWDDFIKSLFPHDYDIPDIHVCMGDLFDKWAVSYTIIYNVARAYRDAAHKHPDTSFVIIRGNHDASRDLERVSAFGLLEEMLTDVDNIWFASRYTVVLDFHDNQGVHQTFAFIPWDPVLTAEEVVERDANLIKGARAVFGHWDVSTKFESTNLIPAKALKNLKVRNAFTGHEHTPTQLTVEGLPVTVTGSMQPYSFAEDPSGKMYVTLSLLEAEQIRPEVLKNRCVRVLLQEGQQLTTQIDCLQLRTQRMGEESPDEDISLHVEVKDFSFEEVFAEVMAEHGVPVSLSESIALRINDERIKA